MQRNPGGAGGGFPNSSLCFDGVQPGDGWNPQSLDWAEWSDWSRCQIFQEGIYKSLAICLGLLCSMLIVSSAATIFSLSVSLLFNSSWRMVLGNLQSDTQRGGSGSGRIWEECFRNGKGKVGERQRWLKNSAVHQIVCPRNSLHLSWLKRLHSPQVVDSSYLCVELALKYQCDDTLV